MTTKELLNKRNVVRIEIAQDVVHSVKVVYIKVMVRSLIMSGSTGKVDSRVFRPEWSAVMQTVFANLHVLK